jgi:hypothetical protein
MSYSPKDKLLRLKLLKNDASRLHAVSKTRGFTTMLNLANIETALRVAGNVGQEYLEEVLSAFINSTHFLSPGTIDMVKISNVMHSSTRIPKNIDG